MAVLSRFTPSLMSGEQLERLFVAREPVLDSILKRVRASRSGGSRHHTLLVGPRGAGKTHLVALAHHRVRQIDDGAVVTAWLAEDPWTIASYRHLLRAIVGSLSIGGEVDRSATSEDLERVLADTARQHGPVVIFLENLDQILRTIGPEGQQRLRHVLQADRSLLLVATTTHLERTMSDQAFPFYGFFTTTRLEPFDLPQATAMLQSIAREQGDERLVEFLESDTGQARLRAITHLAGGQPRMWASLAAALDVGGLDDLVNLLLTNFDDLTPYYQERLDKLSTHQRLVVAEMAELDHPINVRELSERLEIDQRSLAKTLTELTDRGWTAPIDSPLTAHLDRRRTYYELAEPMVALAFQLKSNRGEPLRLVVDFLKNWFDPAELDSSSDADASDYLLTASKSLAADQVVAVTRRLHRLPVSRVSTVELLDRVDCALESLGSGDAEPVLGLASPIRAALEAQLATGNDLAMLRTQIHESAQAEFGRVPHDDMNAWIVRTESLVRQSPNAIPLLVHWLGRAWRFEEAQATLAGLEGLASARARNELGISLRASANYGAAVTLAESVLADLESLLGPDHPDTLTSRHNLASSYWQAGRTSEAITLQEVVLADYERLLGPDHPDTLRSRHNLASSYWRSKRTNEAITLQETVLADRERILGPDHPDTLTSRANLATCFLQAGRTDEAIAVGESVLADRERLLGPDHPDSLITRNDLASSYVTAGRTDEAMTFGESVLADLERLLGTDHPHTLTSRNNLATTYFQAGRIHEAVSLAESVLADRKRILGPDHPDTQASRDDVAFVQRNLSR